MKLKPGDLLTGKTGMIFTYDPKNINRGYIGTLPKESILMVHPEPVELIHEPWFYQVISPLGDVVMVHKSDVVEIK